MSILFSGFSYAFQKGRIHLDDRQLEKQFGARRLFLRQMVGDFLFGQWPVEFEFLNNPMLLMVDPL
jgi:hypothetical protein